MTTKIDPKLSKKEENYALRFRGYLEIPADGVYAIHMVSADTMGYLTKAASHYAVRIGDPATLAGAWVGKRVVARISDRVFVLLVELGLVTPTWCCAPVCSITTPRRSTSSWRFVKSVARR